MGPRKQDNGAFESEVASHGENNCWFFTYIGANKGALDSTTQVLIENHGKGSFHSVLCNSGNTKAYPQPTPFRVTRPCYSLTPSPIPPTPPRNMLPGNNT